MSLIAVMRWRRPVSGMIFMPYSDELPMEPELFQPQLLKCQNS